MGEREHKKTYADDLTIDEIAYNDMQMTLDVIKNANRYHFGQDMRKAVLFVRECIDKTLRHLGIHINRPKTAAAQEEYAKRMDKAMADKLIRIEHRNNYRGPDTWRCGIYIYQRDESWLHLSVMS
jgi:hypothetical protein